MRHRLHLIFRKGVGCSTGMITSWAALKDLDMPEELVAMQDLEVQQFSQDPAVKVALRRIVFSLNVEHTQI